MTTTAKNTTHIAGDVQEQYAHTAQTMAKHLADAQARNLKYTQRIFESTIAFAQEQYGRYTFSDGTVGTARGFQGL